MNNIQNLKEKMVKWKRQCNDILPQDANLNMPKHNLVIPKEDSNFKKIEKKFIEFLCDKSINFPIDFSSIIAYTSNFTDKQTIKELLLKFSIQKLIELNEYLPSDGEKKLFVLAVDYEALKLLKEKNEINQSKEINELKRPLIDSDNDEFNTETKNSFPPNKLLRVDDELNNDSVQCILSLQSIKEKENKKIAEEILHLLSKPTTKEIFLNQQFRSSCGQVQEFCSHGTREECMRSNRADKPCSKLHFLKIIQKHTDESLGDCSFLNTCFHMDTCKYVHYKVENKDNQNNEKNKKENASNKKDFINQTENDEIQLNNNNTNKTMANINGQTGNRVPFPPQWIECDLRFFDMSILGKFAVVMADPPWDIHMELPYGTMSDDEMRNLNIPCLQDEGLIFLWVTGRAMELGRECLKLWGYKQCDELIWVKTNQLQRIIRTGRTGHWLNHGKEHCLVGVKGSPKSINKSLDCDVIVAEVRATSHKPDEIYGIIERLSPGTRKIELFGRQHNTQPNWVTLGNQLDGVSLGDPALIEAFNTRYPEQAIRINTNE